jgi:hypothetical protein
MIFLPIGSVALLIAVLGYRVFKRRRRPRYDVGSVSESWLAEQRRDL